MKMVVFIAVGFIAVGVLELSLWPERPFRKVAVYLFLLALMAAFSLLVTLNINLPVPSPIDWLSGHFERLMKGVNVK